MIAPEDLLHETPKGLYCPIGDFYIDPVRKVDCAVITHGHADHARSGHNKVLATQETLDLMQERYGPNFTKSRQTLKYGQSALINNVTVSFAPAGHVLGSAQVIVEYKGLKIVCTGDYKRRHDPTCAEFEVVPCHVFITEATFGLPIFKHPIAADEVDKLLLNLRTFPQKNHFIGAYSLGKAQRVIMLLREAGYDRPIWYHKSMHGINGVYEKHGVQLGDCRLLPDETDQTAYAAISGDIIIGPSSTLTSSLSSKLNNPVTTFTSGWMRVRKSIKQSGVDLPLIISDHADWDELTMTIKDVRPDQLWITHGKADALMRWAKLNNQFALPLNLVGFGKKIA